MSNTNTVKIGTAALEDHLIRLYESDDWTFHIHIDEPGAYITVINWGKTTSTIELTDEALEQFIDDMDYQTEFAYDGDSIGAAYRARCKRAMNKLKEVK